MENLKLLSKIALAFQNLDHFDKDMNEILSYIGNFLDLSRIYILINDSEDTLSNTFEWCKKGITTQMENLQNVEYKSIPSWNKIFENHGCLWANDIRELPIDIIEALESQKIKSIVVYPLIIKAKTIGYIGFDECEYNRQWKSEELEILNTISGVIANTYERKFSQENLIDSETNFRNFFESIDDMFMVSDLKGRILHCNKTLVDKLGYSIFELKEMEIIDLHPQDIKEEALRVLEEIFKKQRAYCSLDVESKSGQLYAVDTRFWFGKWDNEDCIYSISKDVTRENENFQLFHRIFRNNPLVMSITSLDERRFIKVNPAFTERLGYTEEEVIGKTIEELDMFLDFKKIKFAGTLGREKGKIKDIELVLRCKDGSLLNGVFSMEEIISGGNKSLLTVMVDVTERVELTRSLEDKCEKLTNIIEGTKLGTWEWNIKTGELEINEQWAEMIGYTLEELGTINIDTWTRFPHPKDLKESNAKIERHLNREIEFYEYEIRMKHKDGRWIWVHDRGKVIEKDTDGLPLKMFGTHSDISLRKEAEKALKESEKRFSLALEKTKAGLWDMDMINGDLFLSPMWKKLLGYEDYEIENSYKAWKELWHPKEIANIEKTIDDYLNKKSKNYEMIHRLKHKDGSWRWILTRGAILRDYAGEDYRWIGTHIDVTKEYEQSLELERFFSVNLDLLCIADIEGNFIKTNKAWEDILGYSRSKMEASKFLDFVHPEDIPKTLEAMEQLKNDLKVINFTNRYISIDGLYHHIEWRSIPYEGVIYAAARDISERIEYENRLLEISNRDSLTNIYNRRYVLNRVTEIVEEYKRTEKLFALCILDIDHFKNINDKYGHQMGDCVLREFTKVINQSLRPYDILGRYGGEEFIIILKNANQRQSEEVIERLLNTIRNKVFIFNEEKIIFTFSAGIVNSNEMDKTEISIETLVEIADKRMYQAKEEGKNKVVSMKNSKDFTVKRGCLYE